MVLVQKWPFFQHFFLANIGKENVFYDILEPKNSFLASKNTKFKKSKNWHFSRGVNPWFWSKNGDFSDIFLLGNTGQENVFYDILEPNNTFLDYKNKKIQKVKKLTFFQWVNSCFWFKNGHFFNFLFRQYRPGKCLLRFPRTKKHLSRL